MTYTETEQIEDGTATHVVWPRGDLSFDIDADGRVLSVCRTNDQVRPRDLEDVIRELRHVSGDQVVEHAVQMSGGGMHIRWDDPEMEDIYPLAKWIPAQQRFGGKVYRRTVIVVADWEEVPE